MAKQFISRKDNIIISAIEIINERGLQGLSTKELALRQGMAESLLYKHFRSKDEVIVGVIEHFACFDDVIMKTIDSSDLAPKEKILEFIRLYIEYYENYPAITSILYSYESLMHEAVTKEIIESITIRRAEFLKKLIMKAQNFGEISSCFAAEELGVIINGTIEKVIFNWRMSENAFPLKEYLLSLLRKLLDL